MDERWFTNIDRALRAGMRQKDNCGICGQSLVYSIKPEPRSCDICGATAETRIYCPQGHYVCDDCHRKEALEILREVITGSASKTPVDILEKVMGHPSVPMHGPEHHAIVPAVIVAAARNAGYPVSETDIEEAISRGSKVPGGWCGYYGACGAALGVGIAVSVLSGATPLKGKERRLAIEGTAAALNRVANNDPRCCKRASRRAIKAAVDYLKENMGIELEGGDLPKCGYHQRNQECPNEQCGYYPHRTPKGPKV
jgi:hypothetical protein